MPNYLRPRIPGATIFLTICLADRGSDRLVRHVDALREAVRRTKAERPFTIDAFVVLPDHLHAVWTLPDGDTDYSTRVGALKARFSMAMRRAGFTPPPPTCRVNGGANPALRRKGEIGVWQPRYWEHHIRDARDLDHAIAYCWRNPVKHGLTDDPFDWPHSSIHRDMRTALSRGADLARRGSPTAPHPATLRQPDPRPTLSPAAPLG